MKWRGQRGSRNVEDRRRSGGGTRAGGIGGIGLILVLAIGYFLGIDVSPLIGGGGSGGAVIQSSGSTQITEADEERAEFTKVALGYTEVVWDEVFKTQLNAQYRPPILVLFAGATQSPCGGASGATGPFYCPGDQKVYLDTNFFVTMSRKMGAKGDFASAYVVAHEVAHHIQNQLGTLGQANKARARMSQEDSNLVSVMIELQADCYSGIWARYAEERLGVIEQGDLMEAVNAAKQIGDDTLQRNAGRRPMPHTFTHGSSEQRQRWFAIGYKQARVDACDTFNASNL